MKWSGRDGLCKKLNKSSPSEENNNTSGNIKTIKYNPIYSSLNTGNKINRDSENFCLGGATESHF